MSKPLQRGRPAGIRSPQKEVAAAIAKKISAGEYPIGQPLPPLRALAKVHNVSVPTISRALSILSKDGSIQHSPRHRPIASQGCDLTAIFDKAIALVSPYTSDRVLADTAWLFAIYRGIAKVTRSNGTILFPLFDPHWASDFPAVLNNLPLQGIVLISCPLKPHLLKQYETMLVKYPVISVDEPVDSIHSVCMDNEVMIREATTKLIQLGHRKIAFIRPFHVTPGWSGFGDEDCR